MSARPVTIVIPVYADWPSLSDCLDALLETVDLKKHRVMLVNDGGPEADQLEKNIKAKIDGHSGFAYYRNPKNLGFVGTCNRAVMELDKSNNDILLLNSDTKPTTGWLEELQAILYNQKNIGAVSPRSNNANNCTIPLAAFINKKYPKPEKAYQLFLKYKSKLPRTRSVPTAHGYCMLIRRPLITKYGLFDKAFGRGYGEEVDFCQRIGQHGWRSVLANRAFVYHLEARSFSSAEKEKILAERVIFLRQRWPEYKPTLTKNIEDSLLEEKRIMGRDAGKMPYNLSPRSLPIKRFVRKHPQLHRVVRVARAQSKRFNNKLKNR